MIAATPFNAAPSSLKKIIQRIDHVTYVTSFENEANFIKGWEALGFFERNRLHTVKYPASHIVLTNGEASEHAWGTMTGLSTSADPSSPINEFVRRYGTGAQHVAYAVYPDADMQQVFEEMQAAGYNFMTPVLDYRDAGQARLRQMFLAPTQPFGPFIEFVQRLAGPDGKSFNNFDILNIDNLYAGYDEFSKKLLNNAKVAA